MTGTLGERRVDIALPALDPLSPIEPNEGDDTTTAEAGPPSSWGEEPGADGDDTGAQDPHAKKVGFPRGAVVRPLRPRLPFRVLPRCPAWASAIGVGLPMLRLVGGLRLRGRRIGLAKPGETGAADEPAKRDREM